MNKINDPTKLSLSLILFPPKHGRKLVQPIFWSPGEEVKLMMRLAMEQGILEVFQ